MEFLARFGPGFLAEYHRAWVRSPCGLALAARDRQGRLIGVMLGSLDPASHYKAMLTQSGPQLAARMVASAATRPRLAYELAVTRSGRYSRALLRHLRARFTLDRGGAGTPSTPSADSGSRIGEITHLMVDPAVQRSGAGRALVDRTVELARSAGLDKLVLVTPPDMAARRFYDALGWTAGSELTSRSGEKFVSYSLLLSGGSSGASGS
ncbi:MAG: GNAT family N-acetyltransferase [Acidimicrobiales bacterium]